MGKKGSNVQPPEKTKKPEPPPAPPVKNFEKSGWICPVCGKDR